MCRGVTEEVSDEPVGEESHIQQLEVSLQCGGSRLANMTEKLTGQMEFKVRQAVSCKSQKEDWVKLSLEVDFGAGWGEGRRGRAERQPSRQRDLPCKSGDLSSFSGTHVKMRRESWLLKFVLWSPQVLVLYKLFVGVHRTFRAFER